MMQFSQDEQEIEVVPLSAQGPTEDELAPMFDECEDDESIIDDTWKLLACQARPPDHDAVVDIATALLDGPFTPDALAAWVAAYDIRAAEYALQHAQEMLRLEEIAAINSWNKLLQTPGYVERDLCDVRMFIEAQEDESIAIQESIANGDFPDFENLKSSRLGATVSAQFDEQDGTLLIATNETQIVLSALETQALLCLLHDERDALYEVLHKEMHGKY